MITVLVDAHLPYIDSFLGDDFNIIRFENASDISAKKQSADALLVRTTLKLFEGNDHLLSPSLKFICSATAGIDHLDIPWLNSCGISVKNAPGCNARAVAEYVITGILHFYNFDLELLRTKKVGIAGFGFTGSSVAKILKFLGITYVTYDPPLEERNPIFKSCSFEELLSCEVLTFHVPLTENTIYPTRHMLGFETAHQTKAELIINASRGGVIDEQWLLKNYLNPKKGTAITDVWEGEPDINLELLKTSFIATPHTAGYSIEAKHNASFMVCKELCDYFGKKMPKDSKSIIYPIELKSSTVNEAVLSSHTLFELDSLLKGDPSKFSQLRNSHPLRNEFSAYRLTNIPDEEKDMAVSLGFTILN